ncbi:MAG: hypothetical protein IT494_01260 [Gammaproteobacteria bacterium]|nr:hypothetical protein [Gammaproteobacteria bacterium]
MLIVLLSGMPTFATAEDARIAGRWELNIEASDDPDKVIERTVRTDGGNLRPPSGTDRRSRGRYRGGPEDEALYDRVTFDTQLTIALEGDAFIFLYADGFERRFSTGRTTRTQSASGTQADDNLDFSFAYWDGPELFVESRPRDHGWILETYRLREETGQLELRLDLNPVRFGHRIELRMLFDRAP